MKHQEEIDAVVADRDKHHTPGPWSVKCHQSMYGDFNHIVDANGSRIYETDGNARLIAAAPELLQACKIALSFTREYGPLAPWTERIIDRCEKAISNAEGRSK